MKDDDNAYMTRWWLGRLRFHIFHREDLDDDPHDHPWGFWTFPLTSYVEEVLATWPSDLRLERQIVRRFRWHRRSAEHCHRVLGALDTNPVPRYLSGEVSEPYAPVDAGKKVKTIVWRLKPGRKWGFWKKRNGRWCWQFWKEYVAGGKNAPCA